MKIIYQFLTLLIFFIAIGKSNGNCNERKDSIAFNDVKNIALSNNLTKKINNTIEKEIKYYAPNSGAVYLVWATGNYPLEESVKWNGNTKQIDGLLYTPMAAKTDTFVVKIEVLNGTSFQYTFETTRTKQGAYQDFYDEQSGGNEIITNDLPIFKTAIYTKEEKTMTSEFVLKGWIVLLLSIVFFVLLYWIQKKTIYMQNKPQILEKVLFIGLSMAFFYSLARAEIIGIDIVNVLYNPRLIPKIFRASIDDYLYIIGLLTIFSLIVFLIRNQHIKKWVFGIFVSFALLSTLFAFTNITTVIFLGRPFNYQWLYYSGFLGSNEAKTALSENLSAIIVINLIAITISMPIFASVFQKSYRLLIRNSKIKNVFLVIFGLCMLGLVYKTLRTEATWTKGQSENAITSLVYSMISTNTNSSFFTAMISNDSEAFDPKKSTKIESPNIPTKANSVKNILLIVLESSGAKYFDGYGGNFHLSPNLNKYAAHALMFDQMYAHAPATNLSLASILGSMYPYLSYKSLTQEAPDVEYPTLSSVLKNKGYRTSFFSSADLRFQNCRQFLDHREFDNIEDFSTIQCSEQFKEENFKDLNGIDDLCLANQLTSWLNENSGKNFFSMLWTVQPHYPYFFNSNEVDFGKEDFNFNRYLNCLNHEDKLVGEVMKVLEEKHLDSTTLVVVFGDHGEAFGQHGQYGHGTAIYEENLKVPLYFINPLLFHGERKGDIAEMKDIATTILSFLNIQIPEIWQGRDLFNTNSYETFFFAPWSDYLFGYRKDNMKYIFNESQNTTEIYDLNQDPEEKTNLYNSGMKDEVSIARNRVAAWAQFQNRFIKQILKQTN